MVSFRNCWRIEFQIHRIATETANSFRRCRRKRFVAESQRNSQTFLSSCFFFLFLSLRVANKRATIKLQKLDLQVDARIAVGE